MTTYQTTALPELATGYQLDGLKSFWMAAIPEACTNYVTNPSVETATTGYTNSNFTAMVQSSDKATGGFFSLKLTPNGSTDNTMYYACSGLTQGQVYTWSLDVYGYVGESYTISVRDNTSPSTILGHKTYRFEQVGWQRLYVTWLHNIANPARLQLLVPGTVPASHFIYTDRWQVANKSYLDTYVDGDQRPYINDTNKYAFTWTGTPHASTSKRAANTIGGKLVAFDTFGFRTSGIQGLDVGPYEAVFNGEYYGNYLTEVNRKRRQFTITGRIYGESPSDLAQKKQALINTLRPRWNGRPQPVRLFYQPVTQFGRVFGKLLYIDAICIEGLSGNYVSYLGEEYALVFQADDPYLYEYSGVSLASLTTPISGVNKGLLERNESGNYSALITGSVNGSFDCVAYRGNGNLLVGGTFTTLGGSSLNRIAEWNGTTWAEPTNGGVNGQVYAIAAGVGNEIGVVGAFTAADDATVIRKAAIHDGTGWAEMANGLNDDAYAIVAYPNGDYYVGGNFTANAGGGTQLRYFARYVAETGTWQEVGSGFDDNVNCLVLGPDGRIYIGGDFLNNGANDTGYVAIAAYDPLTGEFDDLGGGLNPGVFGLAFGPGGFLYAVGSFQTEWLAIRPVRRVARWNGGNWEEVGGGLDNYPDAIGFDGKNLYISGTFTDPLNGDYIVRTDTVVCWDGNNWVNSDYYVEEKAGGFALSPAGKFAIAQGDVTGGPEYIAMQTVSVVNGGTAETHPVIKVATTSPSFTYLTEIRNLTTGQVLYFNQLPIKTDVIIDMRGTLPRIYDETGGDLSRFISQGASTPEDFRLVVGTNVLGFMGLDDLFTVTIMWPNTHWSVQGAVSNG